MKVEGACHCGNIRYEAELDPEMVGICHCTDCQALSGSAYRVSGRVSADSFVLSGGPPTVYIKTADSGTKRAHAFCPLCGSPIYAAAPENPPTYSLRVGALKQRADLPPVRQIWCGSALPWSMDISGIPQIETR